MFGINLTKFPSQGVTKFMTPLAVLSKIVSLLSRSFPDVLVSQKQALNNFNHSRETTKACFASLTMRCNRYSRDFPSRREADDN